MAITELLIDNDELLQRAAQLEEPLGTVPSGNPYTPYPMAPCALPMSIEAAATLGRSTSNMAAKLHEAEVQRQALATLLRNAATAYENTDQAAAQSLSDGASGATESGGGQSPETPNNTLLPGTNLNPATHSNTETSPLEACPDQYADLETNAYQIEQPDQGADLIGFSVSWKDYRQTLANSLPSYDPFQTWSGATAEAVEATFKWFRLWTNDMMDLCSKLSNQAHDVFDAHVSAKNMHPTYQQIKDVDKKYESGDPSAMEEYEQYQNQSDLALRLYSDIGDLPLAEIMAPSPPSPPDV